MTRCVAYITALLALWMTVSTSYAEDLDDPLVVVMLGDSLTAGYGLPPEEALPAQLEARLNENGHAVQVRNGGISGDTTAGGRDRIEWTVAEDTDVVVVALGANDMLRAIPPSETENNLQSIIQQLQDRGVGIILAGMLARPNYGPEYEEEFNTIFPRLAELNDLALYPFLLDGVATVEELNQADGIHPNASGVAAIVDRMGPFLESVLFPKDDIQDDDVKEEDLAASTE